MFKIRRKIDGLFSVGGYNPRFTRTGKVWRTMGQLKSHLNLATYEDDEYEIVELEYVERRILYFKDLYEAVIEKQRKEAEDRDRRHKERLKTDELKQLKALAIKHGVKLDV